MRCNKEITNVGAARGVARISDRQLITQRLLNITKATPLLPDSRRLTAEYRVETSQLSATEAATSAGQLRKK